MKKMFLFAAMASIAFASCTTDEKVFDGTDESNEIRFTAAQYSVQSRAGEHAPGADFTSPVAIWAWLDGTNKFVIAGDNYDPSTEKFSSGEETKYYWPVDDGLVDFVSIPSSMLGTSYFSGPTRTEAGVTTLTFNINGEDYHNTNLMTTQVLTGNRTTGTVALLFRHLLAKIKINVSQKVRNNEDARWTVKINSINVYGLHNNGTVTINDEWTAENGGNDCNWGTTSGDETWNVAGVHQLYADGSAGASATPFASAEPYYLLPQTLATGVQKITISYTVETDYLGNETQPNTVENYSKTFDLVDATSIKAWNMNKNIVYNIAIDPSETLTPIIFTVKEEEWGGAEEGTPDVKPIP